MKDTVLTARRKRTEICSWLVCFVIAQAVHVYAIWKYDAPFSELWSSFFYVFVFSVVLYLVWCVLRICIYALLSIFTHR